MEYLCCPECNYTMSEQEWEDITDGGGGVICPECGEELDSADLLVDD